MRTVRRARRRLALVGVAVVVIGAGVGASARVSAGAATSTKEWASGVCDAFLDFRESVSDTLAELGGSTSAESAAASAKQGLTGAVGDLERALDDLGRPPTPNAADARSSIRSLADSLASSAESIEDALTPAPASAAELASAFAVIGGEAQQAVAETKETATALRKLRGDSELRKAFSSSSSCKELKQQL